MLVSDLIRFRDNLLDKIAKLNHEQEIMYSCNLLNLSISENLDIAPFVAHEKILNFINELQKGYNQSVDAKKILLTAIDDTNRSIDSMAIETLSGNKNTPFQSFFRVGENNQYLNSYLQIWFYLKIFEYLLEKYYQFLKLNQYCLEYEL